ncbi:hypothetical protein OEZ86_004076 [Tetradesmus obliquus]|nr:hypothetical protein OEZ86_004076 [Tetradesmus obliquus]
MKFSNQLEAAMAPQWRQHYLDYKALKKKLKQAQAAGEDEMDFLAATPQTTSLSIARALATGSPRHPGQLGSSTTMQQQQQQQDQELDEVQQQQQSSSVQQHDSSSVPQQQQRQQQQQQQPQFFSAYGLAPFGTAQEQFLQMLQQDLAKVRDFIHAHAAVLSASLEALAAAAPQLAQQDWRQLEAQAQQLGQQLLALEQFIHLNQTGFVKIVKKHDKCLPDSPMWHLYLHHLQRTPWLQEQQRQYLWAALSSCYYHLHAGVLAGSSSSISSAGRSSGRAGKGSSSTLLQQQQVLVYFDNKGLELYHGRLYLRPNTQTLKARWIGHNDGAWAPARVVLERKIYKEGWKGERNAKDSLLIAGDVLPSYLRMLFAMPFDERVKITLDTDVAISAVRMLFVMPFDERVKIALGSDVAISAVKHPPLFRPEGRSPLRGWRARRWGHPVQLLECREFFYSEAIFLDWLRVAITMASVAVLLLGFSAMAYVNPLKRPVLHVAEMISLLLLPASCVVAGYAIRVYVWRSKRLHSMRYRRVDDQVGPILMTAVFVAAMTAALLVNIADLVLLLKWQAKHAHDDDDDDGGGTENAAAAGAAAGRFVSQLRLL